MDRGNSYAALGAIPLFGGLTGFMHRHFHRNSLSNSVERSCPQPHWSGRSGHNFLLNEDLKSAQENVACRRSASKTSISLGSGPRIPRHHGFLVMLFTAAKRKRLPPGVEKAISNTSLKNLKDKDGVNQPLGGIRERRVVADLVEL